MTLSDETIILDIKGDKFFYYLQQFHTLKTSLDIIKEQNDYKILYDELVKIKNFPNHRIKFKKIYGEDVTFEEFKPKKDVITKVVKTYKVPFEKWDNWFYEFNNNKKIIRINLFNTYYNSNTNEIIVSTVFMER